MLADIDQVAVDSSSAANIVVAAELVVDMAVVDIEAAVNTEVVAGIVQRRDMDKYSSYVDY